MPDLNEPRVSMNVPEFVEQVALISTRILMEISDAKHESGMSISNYTRCRGFVIDILNLLRDQYNFDLCVTEIEDINRRLCAVYKVLPEIRPPTFEEYHKQILEP